MKFIIRKLQKMSKGDGDEITSLSIKVDPESRTYHFHLTEVERLELIKVLTENKDTI